MARRRRRFNLAEQDAAIRQMREGKREKPLADIPPAFRFRTGWARELKEKKR